MTTETVFGQTLALRLGDGDEHRALESDTTGLKGNLYLYLNIKNYLNFKKVSRDSIMIVRSLPEKMGLQLSAEE